VLLKEMQSLALDVSVLSEGGSEVEVREEDDELLRAAEELGIDLSPGSLRAAARQPTGQELEEGQDRLDTDGELALPADEVLEDFDALALDDDAGADLDVEDAPVGALDDIDVELED
jgi:DNA-directed RNA polymerase subunit beta